MNILNMDQIKSRCDNQRQGRSDMFYITEDIRIEIVILENNQFVAWRVIYETHNTKWVASSFTEFFQSALKIKELNLRFGD